MGNLGEVVGAEYWKISDFLNAVESRRSLTDEEVESLGIDQPTIEIIQKILERHKFVDSEIEPEFHPLEMEINE